MPEFLFVIFEGMATAVEAAAVVVCAFGAAEAFIQLVGVVFTGATHGARKAVWRRFGMWLLLALEFALAADIIRSVISPSWQEIGQLAAIALVRTFLNYFLERDLEQSHEAAEA